MNYLFIPLLVLCCVYAFMAGGGPERVGAAAYGLSCFASVAVFTAPVIRFQTVEVGVFIVDVLVFVIFIALALRANRFWPIWVSGLLGLGVLGHLARWAGPDVIPWAYAVILSVWSYPILAVIALGTFNHQRRLKRFGEDKSWSSSSGRSGPAPPTGPTI
ncbi:MAG: hypothetical protein QOH47_505 [Sphingomonadales bacterium]|nr:hypothetical protein [Sphingomonadales bacterium]